MERVGATEGHRAGKPLTFLPSKRTGRYWLKVLLLLGVIAGLHVWAWIGVSMDLAQIGRGAPHMWDFLVRMVPPDWAVTQTVMGAAVETLQIAILGTTLGALAALPLGFLAARNVAHPVVRDATRTLLNAIRSVPLILYALFFVAAVGLGATAGTLAVIVYTTGILGKFYSEAVENADPRPFEGVLATGANRVQAVRFGIVPQVLPHFVDYTLYRLEINFRESMILGLVGAGGIGFYITLYMRSFAYHRVATVTFVILVAVVIVDMISSQVRKRLV